LTHLRGTGLLFTLGVCALACGCTSSPSLPSAPVVVVSAASTSPTSTTSHAVVLDRGSLHRATLDVTSGTTAVSIKVAALPGQLIAASTPVVSTQVPALALSGDGVATLALSSSGGTGGVAEIDVLIDSSVAWTINLDGGATEEHIDMRGGHLVRLDLAAGTTRATVILPARLGTQIVREVGGASVLTVATPPSVLARVQVGGGAGGVQIGAITHSGVPAGRTLADVGYQQAQQRLDVQLVGGVSRVQIH
jgi:hypothetical protein